MPIFGESSKFAVEYELDADPGGEWMFGRICYWLCGCRVGKFDLGTSLRDVLFQLDGMARNKGRRMNRRFCAMSAISAFQLLNGTLFGRVDVGTTHVAEEEEWARHLVFPPVDVFDEWKGFLVGDEQTERLIFACDPYFDIMELRLRAGEVDSVLDLVRDALTSIYDRESVRGAE